MGANPTQGQAIVLFFLALFFVAAGLAAAGNILLIVIGLALAVGSCGLFLKCKPWEHRED